MMMFRGTAACLRRARVTIPRLSPTHTEAKILKWCHPSADVAAAAEGVQVREYDPIMLLECSADLVTEAHRDSTGRNTVMIVEAMEEGVLKVPDDGSVELDTWYPVGLEIGEVDDGDESGGEFDGDWLWQAYLVDEEKGG